MINIKVKHFRFESKKKSKLYKPTEYKTKFKSNLLDWDYNLVSKTVMKDAIAINDMEPDSNFFLANLLSAKGNLTGAMHHYKQSVQMKPDYAAALQFILVRNGILLPKMFWPTVRKNCFSGREKLLKFEVKGQEFAKFLRSLEQFIQTVKDQNNFW